MHALAPSLVAAPAAKLIDVATAKAHLRVDHSDDDTLIAGLIDSAIAHLDGWGGTLGRCLITQTWREDFCGFPPCGRLRLRLAPIVDVVSIAYSDAANADQALQASVYAGPFTDALGPHVSLKFGAAWPSVYPRDDAVRVTYKAGYGLTANDVPAAIRHAALLMVGHWYEHREDAEAGTVPKASNILLAPLRRVTP
ncbi:head-tail connector protein [Xanthobacter flavus]|uniref:head-tail connector protein n=1 Tax=Xanthobacter flavus TaxID=281 RepID=UPI00372AC5E3